MAKLSVSEKIAVLEQYEEAYAEANPGKIIQVINVRSINSDSCGWYQLLHEDGTASSCYRISQLVEMTERLNDRVTTALLVEQSATDSSHGLTKMEKLMRASEIIAKRIAKLENCQYLIQEARKEVAGATLGIATDDFELADSGFGQLCQNQDNPLEECVYDGIEDPVWDDCLFCHKPWERK